MIIQSFLREQLFGGILQDRLIESQYIGSQLEGLIQQGAHRCGYPLRHIGAETQTGISERRIKKLGLWGVNGQHTDVVRHAILGHHGSGNVGGFDQVIGCTGSHFAEYQLLSSPPCQQHGNPVLQILFTH